MQGATPEDWAAWARLAESDLLPVVMDPAAKISDRSNMKDLGKTPSRFNQNGEAVGIPQWTSNIATGRDIGRWMADTRLGLCVIARTVKAIDIDIEDATHAREIEDFIALVLGQLPRRRRSNSGKSLLAFRLPVDFPKRVIRTAHGIIELLSDKQQFVACGTHKSGARIEWVDDDTGVIGPPAALPDVTFAELDVVWQALIDKFALPEGASTERNGMLPAIPRTREDLQDPAVGWLDENGWVTGFERDGRVNVRCPWADGHSTDTGPSSTTYFPAGVGGFAMGHFRCLHASCSQRTDGDFMEATGCGASDFEVLVSLPDDKGQAELPAFTRDKKTGRVEPDVANVVLALRREDVCGTRVGIDLFTEDLMIGDGKSGWRRFDDADYVALRIRLGNENFKPVGRDAMKDAVLLVAKECAFDSAIQWAETLVWDGVPRVDTFWSAFFGVPDTPYARAVAAYTWTGLAGRALEPGVKCDMVPVLIGLQGAGKTTAVEAIAPSDVTFVELALDRKDDDLSRSLRGKLVGELAELRGLQGRTAESIKAWITRRNEEWVPKYREFSTRYGRRCLFIGTGNREGFLDDETGERRWLPMTVGVVDVAGIKAVRDQLWAEGVARFKSNGVEWQGAYSLGKDEHKTFKVEDAWDDIVAAWLDRDDLDGAPRGDIRVFEVLVSALGFKADRIDKASQMRCAKVLARLGLTRQTRWLDGRAQKVWERRFLTTIA